MINTALFVLVQVLTCGLLMLRADATVLAVGTYEGWHDDYRFFCKMDIEQSTEMEIVADVDIRHGWTGGKCVNCHFEYGVWTGADSRDKTHVAALGGFDEVSQSTDDPTDACLAKLGEAAGVGYDCSWNAYPTDGLMIFELCDAHFELTQVY
ncbi:hypothetical protein FOZ60_004707 [Perkinsus olseni]|uniref:Uncharacterized protein n=1 Tax=Perkinsus olseni TaxID=32597 RepID=A0A7J6NTK8_PEROL|nr:hypothetical protein FOZ60_004707 [Perkinsus olseni]